MKTELDHFRIGPYIGGDQEWFTDSWMKIGGCGAVTACDLCIYLAKHKGMRALYPFDPDEVTMEDYLAFGMRMRAFLTPRATGINRTSIFVDGLNAYLASCGVRPIRLQGVSGEESVQSAEQQICGRIDRGFPVPYLMLMHRDRKLKDYMWHWFLLNGYDASGDALRVRAVSYGEQTWMDFPHLWQTGRRPKGGFVRIEPAGTQTD